jgi:HAD superfamily phosphoserine phosphatase-like hydrolase
MTKLAFFDLDKTLYDGWSTADFYYMMANNGWTDVSIIEEDDALRRMYTSGHYTYDDISKKVIELGISLLAGKTRQEVLAMEDEFLKISLKLYDYSKPLLRMLTKHGFICYLVSAATFPPVEAIGRELSMPFFASTGAMQGTTYTGELLRFMNGEQKRKAVVDVIGRAQKPVFSLAFGDSTGDLPLLEAADQAFVVNPHQEEMSRLVRERKFTPVEPSAVLRKVALVLQNSDLIMRD